MFDIKQKICNFAIKKKGNTKWSKDNILPDK